MRFALLEHTTPDGVHWDLLVERPGQEKLTTWRLLANPLEADDVPAERIADHRRLYLDYEGPISGGRGSVRRLDTGECECEVASDGIWRLRLRGRHLRGEYWITLRAGTCMVLARSSP